MNAAPSAATGSERPATAPLAPEQAEPVSLPVETAERSAAVSLTATGIRREMAFRLSRKQLGSLSYWDDEIQSMTHDLEKRIGAAADVVASELFAEVRRLRAALSSIINGADNGLFGDDIDGGFWGAEKLNDLIDAARDALPAPVRETGSDA